MDNKIEELRALEANLQGLLAQKQRLQMEMNEIGNALSELRDYKDDAYKVVSGIMIKTGVKDLVKELEEKNKLISGQIGAIEKQEDVLDKRAGELRGEMGGKK